MVRVVVWVLASAALGTTLGGCGCGGTPGLSEAPQVSAAAPGVPALDLSLIGPANESTAASANEETAAILTFAHGGTLTGVDLLLSAGATAGTLVLEVRPVLGDVPDPTRLLASVALDASALPPAPGLMSVDVAPLGLRVSAGQTVAVVLRSGTGTAGWWGPRNDWAPYAHAAHRTRPAAGAPWDAWQATPATDLCFRTWVAAD